MEWNATINYKSPKMEIIVMPTLPQAENRFWHKNCFRCTTCNKPLAVDSYQSHESILYCKPHFKQLFCPKTVLDADDVDVAEKRGASVIIRNARDPEPFA